jgi:hypothetical protein
MANLNGWGRGTWGQLGWGEGSIPVEPTGVEATGAVNGVGVNGQAVATVGGITATLGAVSVTINADANVDTTGLGLTSALGTLTSVTGKANISPTGQEGTSALGTVTPQAGADVSLDGVNATLGNVSVLVDAEATIIITTGVEATGSTGTLSTITDNRFPAPGFANLRASDPFVNPTVNAACNFTIIGVSATGQVGTFNIWEVIDDSQNPNWTEIAA